MIKSWINVWSMCLLATDMKVMTWPQLWRAWKVIWKKIRKSEKQPKYSNWFHAADKGIIPSINTRSDKTILQTKHTQVFLRTDRYTNSPIPFLTELLNKDCLRINVKTMCNTFLYHLVTVRNWLFARKTSYRTICDLPFELKYTVCYQSS
jgi:hypothetical protein